jgi:chromosome segregation ATPase
LRVAIFRGTISRDIITLPQGTLEASRGIQRMAKQVAVARTTDLEPIDRLEEKIRLLVDMIGQLRAEQAKSEEDRKRLLQELDLMRARLSDAEATSGELTALRDERDVIRTRVAEMLQQLEAI